MIFLQSVRAVIEGFRRCFFSAEIRRLALRPWLIGFVVYLGAAYAAYVQHPRLLSLLISEPSTWWMYPLFWGAWLLTALILAAATVLLTLVIVLILTGVFSSGIASQVFAIEGLSYAEEESGLRGLVKETGRTLSTELLKLLWIVPISLAALVMGFIPWLVPFGILLASGVLAYESFDVPLDVLKLPLRQRWRYTLRHIFPVLCFGLILTVLALIPLLGFLLPPIAIAGAAWFIAQHPPELPEKAG